MKRRDFVVSSSLTLAALAASERWLGSVLAGEPAPITPSVLDTYFQVSKAEMDKLLTASLSKGADFADIFFEYRISSTLSFEEDQVKSARRGIVRGVGIRAIKDDQVGFAFTEDLSTESMMEAAITAHRCPITRG